jgi:Flp pilus assembly protein TadG
MNTIKSEKGQALILIAFGIIALVGFTALAIDGGRAFEERRHAQNAADTAALAGALAYHRGENITNFAQARAETNGYDGNGTTNDVIVTVTDIAAGSGICPGDAAGKEITVDVTTTINTTFARVLGRQTITNTVTAVTHACGFTLAPLFGGNAIVGLKPTTGNCSFDTGNSNAVHWKITGGGVFSNGCAYTKNNSTTTLDPDECVTAVGSASGFTCQQPNQASKAIKYPADVLAIMPPNPCDGTPGDVGLPQGSGSTFTNGIYCISDMDALDKKDIVLNNATLYVTDTVFNLKFAGSGGFYGTPTLIGDYENYYMIIAYDPTPCQSFTDHNAQVIEWRGNGAGSMSGTILAPSACLDLRGNADQSAMESQIIGYIVGSNGNAEVFVSYEEDKIHRNPFEPSMTLEK